MDGVEGIEDLGDLSVMLLNTYLVIATIYEAERFSHLTGLATMSC